MHRVWLSLTHRTVFRGQILKFGFKRYGGVWAQVFLCDKYSSLLLALLPSSVIAVIIAIVGSKFVTLRLERIRVGKMFVWAWNRPFDFSVSFFSHVDSNEERSMDEEFNSDVTDRVQCAVISICANRDTREENQRLATRVKKRNVRKGSFRIRWNTGSMERSIAALGKLFRRRIRYQLQIADYEYHRVRRIYLIPFFRVQDTSTCILIYAITHYVDTIHTYMKYYVYVRAFSDKKGLSKVNHATFFAQFIRVTGRRIFC